VAAHPGESMSAIAKPARARTEIDVDILVM